MQATDSKDLSAAAINYDEAPVAEAQVDEVAYRLDADNGSTVAISRREAGSWEWVPVTTGRWDGSRLRARGLGHAVNDVLARALREAMRNREE